MSYFCLDDSPRFRMIELDGTDSTNTFLANYRPPQLPEITLATAEYQSAGRGQRGNTWESKRGQNLLFSLLISPTLLPANHVFVLSEAIALSIRETIEEKISPITQHPSSITVKWPNDIYVDEQKIAGILIENELAGQHIGRCIIGCGINVNQREWTMNNGQWTTDNGQWVNHPVSLYQLLGHEIERRFVLEHVMDSFTRRYKQIQQGRYTDIHADYLAHLYRRTGIYDYRDMTIERPTGTPFRAELADVEPDGHLVLRDTDGHLRRFSFKEVAFCRSQKGQG